MCCTELLRYAASAKGWQNATTTGQAPTSKNAKRQSDSWSHTDWMFYDLPSCAFQNPSRLSPTMSCIKTAATARRGRRAGGAYGPSRVTIRANQSALERRCRSVSICSPCQRDHAGRPGCRFFICYSFHQRSFGACALWRFVLLVTAHPTNLFLTSPMLCSDYKQYSNSKLKETALWIWQAIRWTTCLDVLRIVHWVRKESTNSKGCV